jgi:hypothetical protein
MAKEGNNNSGAPPDYPREKLNKNLQKIVDRQDDWMDDIYEGQYVLSTNILNKV